MGHSRRRRTVVDADGWHAEAAKVKRDRSAGGARDGAATTEAAADKGGKGGGKGDSSAMRARIAFLERERAAYRFGRANPWNGCRDVPDSAHARASDKSKQGKGKGKGKAAGSAPAGAGANGAGEPEVADGGAAREGKGLSGKRLTKANKALAEELAATKALLAEATKPPAGAEQGFGSAVVVDLAADDDMDETGDDPNETLREGIRAELTGLSIRIKYISKTIQELGDAYPDVDEAARCTHPAFIEDMDSLLRVQVRKKELDGELAQLRPAGEKKKRLKRELGRLKKKVTKADADLEAAHAATRAAEAAYATALAEANLAGKDASERGSELRVAISDIEYQLAALGDAPCRGDDDDGHGGAATVPTTKEDVVNYAKQAGVAPEVMQACARVFGTLAPACMLDFAAVSLSGSQGTASGTTEPGGGAPPPPQVPAPVPAPPAPVTAAAPPAVVPAAAVPVVTAAAPAAVAPAAAVPQEPLPGEAAAAAAFTGKPVAPAAPANLPAPAGSSGPGAAGRSSSLPKIRPAVLSLRQTTSRTAAPARGREPSAASSVRERSRSNESYAKSEGRAGKKLHG